MKILHTADWHLGQKLVDYERIEEQRIFLDWLLSLIQNEKIEVVIIAGDIFDVGNPPKIAEELYYNFLTRVVKTVCKKIIVVAGNHDSARTINAPRELLKLIDVFALGGFQFELSDAILEPIKSDISKEEIVICAVPYLAQLDVINAVAGETFDTREARYLSGIEKHYRLLADAVKARGWVNRLPVFATGHLFAAGGLSSDSERELVIGKLGAIPSNFFPPEFDYIALGHLHRPQIVKSSPESSPNIHYSGSPIQLSFSEINDSKFVKLIEIKDGKIDSISKIDVPQEMILQKFEGTVEEIESQMESISNGEKILAEFQIFEDHFVGSEVNHLKQVARKMGITPVSTKLNYSLKSNAELVTISSLKKQLTPEEMFTRMILEKGYDEKRQNELLSTFKELVNDFYHQPIH